MSEEYIDVDAFPKTGIKTHPMAAIAIIAPRCL